jgi:hypothetical protein
MVHKRRVLVQEQFVVLTDKEHDLIALFDKYNANELNMWNADQARTALKLERKGLVEIASKSSDNYRSDPMHIRITRLGLGYIYPKLVKVPLELRSRR